MDYFISAMKNYATFTGRARRSEYWFFYLFYFIFLVLAVILDNLLGITIEDTGIGPLYFVSILAMIIPGLAVTVRRLHDVGKSGWFYFIVLIPIIGSIWLLVLMVTDGQPGRNKYGKNPKGIGNEVALS
ncbi:DUF805 domain-containing protein [Aquiflexum gelatinilyticum]|mgnify:FL=1|jgi:uncharacterized membrane protein YhaH (DUF805 family)|uniref:DUF805 domain-containing protein n=1 Tax=Aquiflexum gelatinilyticum TaxID=2961943 RepID=UPI002169525E|nr:DUF805 domain-containing protein [Aquiflexum gelatinilyticum]MCS4433901.1 DUF805 domain-containing protein [Aquiflexum gelatinilyticum]